MPKARKPGRTLVHVTWLDASYEEGDCPAGALTPGVLLESGGLLVREDADSISFALDYCPGDEKWRHVAHVPKSLVRKIKRLTV